MKTGWGVLWAVSVGASLGCSQAFRFTDDAGFDAGVDAGPVDAGPDDAGVDAGSDAGFDAGFDGGADAGCNSPGECECQDAGDCAGVRPLCGADHRCVECLAHTDCGTNGLCDPKTRRCTLSCTSSADCDGGLRNRCGSDLPRHCIACDDPPSCPVAQVAVCAESVGFCVECSRDSQCADGGLKPRCDTRFGACVQCLTSAQCAATEFCRASTSSCEPR